MDPRDVIYYTEHRIEKFRREREQYRLAQIARQGVRSPRVFRLFPLRRREPDTTTG